LDKIDPFKKLPEPYGKFSKSKRNLLYLSLALPKINIEGINAVPCSTITAGKQVDGNIVGFTLRLTA
jgi:hypothetical protein